MPFFNLVAGLMDGGTNAIRLSLLCFVGVNLLILSSFRDVRRPSALKPDVSKASLFELSISTSKRIYRCGEPIPVRIDFKNPTESPVTIWSCGVFFNHRFEVKDRDGNSVPLTQRGIQCRDIFSPGGARFKNIPVQVRKGDSHCVTSHLDLNELFQFQPGQFAVTVTYQDDQPPTPLRLTSKPVRFEMLAGDGRE